MITFSDVVHENPKCGWCGLDVRVGELLVFAQLGTRSYGYVHEFCVGKIPAHEVREEVLV